MTVFCGIDWAEDHHDIALVDQHGTLLAKRRIGDDAAGFATLLQLLAEAGDSADAPIPVAIETSRGLLVASLRATGRPVFPINPMSVSRYRDRHSVARRKPDAGDALVLACSTGSWGCLHHCLHTGQTYNEATAFPMTSNTTKARAA